MAIKKYLLPLLCGCCVCSVMAMLFVLFAMPKAAPTMAEFTPPPFAADAVQGVPTVPENAGYSTLTVEDGYQVAVCGVLVCSAQVEPAANANAEASSNAADTNATSQTENGANGSAVTVPVYFTSDATNTVWLKLQLLDAQGTLLAQTGVLRPGEYVQNLTLATAPTTAQEVQLRTVAYAPETWYSMGNVTLRTTLQPAP